MSGEIESVGGLVTGSLVAKAFDQGAADTGELQAVCPNCGAPIRGNFCSQCGQSAHLPRSIAHIFEELLHGVLHFDSRAWRTLPMLVFRPGRLTRDYIEGKRQRYIAPFAMFLFTIFLMYFTFAFLGPPDLTGGIAVDMSPQQLAELQADLETQRKALAAVTAEKAALERAPNPDRAKVASLKRDIAAQKIPIAIMESAVERARQDAANTNPAKASDKTQSVPIGPGWTDEVTKAMRENPNVINIDGAPEFSRRLRTALKNPEFLFYKMQQSAYKFSFLLVPLSLPFVWLLFPFRRNVHIYDHAVFTLYSISFMSLLFIVLAVAANSGPILAETAAPAVAIIPPLHMFVQLKGAYGLGWMGALFRTMLLGGFAIVVLVIFSVIVLALGALG